MASSTTWADTPLELIPTPVFKTKRHDMWIAGASHMCNVHNALFRGFNSIYLQAPHVKEADKADFLGYTRTWIKFLETHAREEESGLFVEAEKLLGEDVFQALHKEHDAIVVVVEELEAYLNVLASPSALSAEKLIDILNRLREPFETHFRQEIDVIASLQSHPNTPKEGSPEQKKAKAVFDKWGENSIMNGGVTDVVVFFLLNLDRTVEDGTWADWPPMPGPVRWILANGVSMLHSGWWKFASCDGSGKPKPLYALP